MNETKGHTKPRRSSVGTGTTSLLMIFTVLCFATLAMLSLSTAVSSQRIQQQGIMGTAALATAKGEAAEQVAQLDAALAEEQTAWLARAAASDAATAAGQIVPPLAGYEQMAQSAAEALGWEVNAAENLLTLHTKVDEVHILVTQLRLLPVDGNLRYEVVRQQAELIDGWQAEGEPVWPGP